ncbi:TPA: hypothetical protein F8R87_00250 [Legionella pneumophila]|nr:hypothetical protein [Legionella pneumophila]
MSEYLVLPARKECSMYNKMFKPLDTDPILYFKMYSNYTEGRIDDCCAFILMPSGLQRDWVCLQSIQFAFNKCGDVLGINIIFSGNESNIHKKVRETMEGMLKLKLQYGRGEELFVFDEEKKTFHLGIVPGKDTQAYLEGIIAFIKDSYRLQPDFAQDIKAQLLNKEYLAQEYSRLRWKPPEKESVCVLM